MSFPGRPLAIFLLAFNLVACAPLGGPSGPGERPDMPPGQDAEDGAMPMADPFQEKLARLAAALALTPAQQPLWDDYQETLGALLADQARGSAQRASQSAVQQIAGKLDVVRNRLSAMEEIQDAATRLYQTLDPRQREVADRMLAASVPSLDAGCAAPGTRRARGGRPMGGGGPGRGNGGPGQGGGPMW